MGLSLNCQIISLGYMRKLGNWSTLTDTEVDDPYIGYREN